MVKADALERLREEVERINRDGRTISLLDDSEHDVFPVAIDSAEGEALRSWVVREKVSHTIEIGLAYGLSALYICEGLLLNGSDSICHVVIDPHQMSGFKNCGLQSLEVAGVVDIIDFHSEESQILLPRFLSEDRLFQLAFVDGSHLFDRVFLDLIYLGRIVNPGGIIFVDDYQLPAIKRAVSFCISNLGWLLLEVSPEDEHHQWAVLRTPSKPISRTFRDYIDF